MSTTPTPKQWAFGRLLLVAGALLLLAFAVYHLGGRGDTATLISQVLNVLGTLTAIVAVLLRWKGRWRENE